LGKLVNRTKLGDAVDNTLLEELTKLSKETNVPRSKLLDLAIELLLKEKEKERKILRQYGFPEEEIK
jgi:metal-responsive CopG/Arc/MetJ family transcriptional regulator